MKKKRKNIDVYVIDDNQVVCTLVQSIENKYSHIKITPLYNAEMAIQEINHKVPEIIFLDYYLDELHEDGPNGDVVLKFLKENIPDIPVVLLTNLKDHVKINELLQIGFDGFIHKSEGNMIGNVLSCISKFTDGAQINAA